MNTDYPTKAAAVDALVEAVADAPYDGDDELLCGEDPASPHFEECHLVVDNPEDGCHVVLGYVWQPERGGPWHMEVAATHVPLSPLARG